MENKKLKKLGVLGLAQVIVTAGASGDRALETSAMQMAERKGIWEEVFGTVELFRKEGRWL